MADNYLQFSFFFPLEGEDNLKSFSESVDKISRENARETWGELEDEDDSFPQSLSNRYEPEKIGDKEGIWVHAVENEDPQEAVRVIRDFMGKTGIDSKVGFCWSISCSQPALEAFGGGAVVFNKDSEKWLDTYTFLHETVL